MSLRQTNLEALQECVDRCRKIGILTEAEVPLRLRVLVQMLQIELEKTVREVADLEADET